MCPTHFKSDQGFFVFITSFPPSNLSVRILHPGLYTFAKVRTRRIHLTRAPLVSDHLLYPRDLYVQKWYCKETWLNDSFGGQSNHLEGSAKICEEMNKIVICEKLLGNEQKYAVNYKLRFHQLNMNQFANRFYVALRVLSNESRWCHNVVRTLETH